MWEIGTINTWNKKEIPISIELKEKIQFFFAIN